MADFRRETDRQARNPDAENLLQPLVTCGICMELYVDPVEFLNCLHLACGACAMQWLQSSSSCPQCREAVHGTRDSHYATSVTDVYQTIAPNSELCQARNDEERRQLRQKYRPGQATSSRNAARARDEARRPEPIELEYEAPGAYGLSGLQISQPERGFSQIANTDVSTQWTPFSDQAAERSNVNLESMISPQNRCQSCDPNNLTGYICPERATYSPHTIPVGHTICGLCARFLPWREELASSRCVVCTRTTCREMGRTCRSSVPQRLRLCALRDIQFPPGWRIPLGRAFGENRYEQDMFKAFLDMCGLGLRDVFQELVASRSSLGLPRATWHGPGHPPNSTTHVNLDDNICLFCALDLVEASLFDWWMSKRSTASLPNQYINRQNCPYGIACRTARLDQNHAQQLNHICQPTQADVPPANSQREDPENGNRFVGESATLNRTFPPYSPLEVTFRDKGNEPMFLTSSIHRDYRGVLTIPGRATIWGPSNVTVYFGLDGEEHEQNGVVQVLIDTRSMRWVQTSRGVIPIGCRPVVGGRMVVNGSNQELYHCAVWWRGQRIPGYTSPQARRAVISWGGFEWYIEDHYEILCWS